jgi:hypothetical protein
MVFVEGVHRLLRVVRYQEHTALSAFYDTPDAARTDIKGETLLSWYLVSLYHAAVSCIWYLGTMLRLRFCGLPFAYAAKRSA